MNVRDNTNSRKKIDFDILSFLFGGPSTKNGSHHNSGLKMYVIGMTVLLWAIVSIISVAVFYFNEDMIFGSVMIHGLMVASMIGGGITLVSIMAHNDWNTNYGWGLFNRSLGYNTALFLLTLTIDSGVGMQEYREPVKEFQFMTTDIKDCEYKIKMVSEHLTYDYCSDFNREYNDLVERNDIDAFLTGKTKYGTNKADFVEFIKKKVVTKS